MIEKNLYIVVSDCDWADSDKTFYWGTEAYEESCGYISCMETRIACEKEFLETSQHFKLRMFESFEEAEEFITEEVLESDAVAGSMSFVTKNIRVVEFKVQIAI